MTSDPEGHRSLVAYSVATVDGQLRADLVRQLEISFGSLRAHSPAQPVVLFSHGPVPDAASWLCRAYGVMVCEQPRYDDRLRQACPTGWAALARYPVLHKYLNFGALERAGYAQVLCCDCDTLFARDVGGLFTAYRRRSVLVAREEVHSSRSPYGYDATFIDESLLAQLGVRLGSRPLPPFNLGAVLFNGADWGALARLEDTFIDLAWRFVIWMALNPVGADSTYAEFQGWAEAVDALTEDEAARALPFPSSNRWILDEVALWLTLGRLPGVSYGDFSPADVAQNGEFTVNDPRTSPWTLCHYFSPSLPRIEAWLASALDNASVDPRRTHHARQEAVR